MSRSPDPASPADVPTLAIETGRLAVVSPVGIAEACFSVPAVRALRHGRPEADLAVLAPESILPLWRTVAEVDRLLSYPDDASPRQIARAVAEAGIEVSFHWEDSEAARALAMAGVARRFGYDATPLRKRLTDPIPPASRPGPVEHRVRHYLGLFDRLGIECYVPRNFATPPLPPRPVPPRIALAPGSTFGAAYRWPLERFRNLGEALAADREVELAILAYPEQNEEADELARLLGGKAQNHAGRFDPAGLLEALAHCTALVANDGALPHLAAHLGVPVVALFGPGDPVARRPLGRQHDVLSEFVACSPCNQPRCPLRHHRCLAELSVERVCEAVTRLLEASPS